MSRTRELDANQVRAVGKVLELATALIRVAVAVGTLEAIARDLGRAVRLIERACVCAAVDPARLRDLPAHAAFADAVSDAGDVVKRAGRLS